MSYISKMTSVLLDEIDMAKKLVEYSNDKAYGIWFRAKAEELIDQVKRDFDYYVEVTDIKKKMREDKLAEEVYFTLYENISNLGINWG